MTFWDGVFLSSFLWLFICVLVILGTAVWALDQDNLTGWSKGFSDGWEAAVKTVLDIANRTRSEGTDPHEEVLPGAE